jgi:hypothetical protein
MAKYLSLILLFGASLTLQAAPLEYTLTGRINHMGGSFESFTGSLLLSQPTTVVLGDGETDSRGDFLTTFNISGFNLASESHSMIQTGPSTIAEFWEQTPPSTFINGIDSVISITTDKGVNDFDLGDWGNLVTWNGAPGEQPSSFHLLTEVWDDYRVKDLTATVIPVPATIWLLGSGLLALIGVARRKLPS